MEARPDVELLPVARRPLGLGVGGGGQGDQAEREQERGPGPPASVLRQSPPIHTDLPAVLGAASIIVGCLPDPHNMLRMIRLGIDRCSATRAAVDARLAETRDTLRRVTAGVEGVRLADPIDVFCTSTMCRPYDGDTVYFKDTIHLSPAGAQRCYRAFDDDIRWALAGE
jgi:SGNH domain (fused to AT3 domains)